MEIAKVETTGSTRVSDSIQIKYNITTLGNDKAITANIIKNEVSIGFFNMSSNQVVGFSLKERNGLVQEEIILIFQTAIKDCYPLFNT